MNMGGVYNLGRRPEETINIKRILNSVLTLKEDVHIWDNLLVIFT